MEDFLPVIRTYSEKFIATLNEQEPEDLTDLSPPYVTSTWLCFAALLCFLSSLTQLKCTRNAHVMHT